MVDQPIPPPLPPQATKRRRVLAPWALLALIPFIAAQIYWAWPAAKDRFEHPNDAIPTFTAELIVALFFTLFCAWLAYRISGRSRFSGSVVFCAFMLLFSANSILPVCTFRLLSRTEEERMRLGRRSPSWKPAVDFPAFGIHAEAPPSWEQAEPKEKFIIAWWGSPQMVDGKPRAFITLQCEDAGSRTLAERAEAVARSIGGRVDEQPMALDGQAALRVHATAAQSGFKPVEVVITSRDDKVFMVIGAVLPGQSCDKQVDYICRTWKWIPRDPNP